MCACVMYIHIDITFIYVLTYSQLHMCLCLCLCVCVYIHIMLGPRLPSSLTVIIPLLCISISILHNQCKCVHVVGSIHMDARPIKIHAEKRTRPSPKWAYNQTHDKPQGCNICSVCSGAVHINMVPPSIFMISIHNGMMQYHNIDKAIQYRSHITQ